MEALTPETFAAFADTLANAAGDLVRKAYGSASSAVQKADKSLVTETDKAIESALAVMIRERFPEHGIFGEEHGRVNPHAPCQWVIDPIDGTNAFIARIPTFTTLIAYCEGGIPVHGIIDQPVIGERWVSSRMSPRAYHQPLSASVIATTSMAYFSESGMHKFLRLRNACGGAVHAGDAYLYAQLANGNIGVVMDEGMKPYDFTALVPVVHAAGGVITDWEGKPITLASEGKVLASASRDIHEQALALLK